MLSGVIVSAALAALVENRVLGSNPIFHVPRLQIYTLSKASSLVWYALLGLLAAIVSVAFTDSLLALRAWFKRLKSVPRRIQPAMGAAATGAMAVAAIGFFHVNGIAGYLDKTLTQALLGNLPVTAMAALCVLKLAATHLCAALAAHRRHRARTASVLLALLHGATATAHFGRKAHHHCHDHCDDRSKPHVAILPAVHGYAPTRN